MCIRDSLYSKPLISEDGRVTTVTRETFVDSILPNGRIYIQNLPGDLVEVDLDETDLMRTNYSSADNRSYRDGDSESSRFYTAGETKDQSMYNSPMNPDGNSSINSTSLISNESRVYKGGSWLDRSYYLDPAQRRFYPEYMTTNFIGFRCAMSYLGEARNTSKPKKR